MGCASGFRILEIFCLAKSPEYFLLLYVLYSLFLTFKPIINFEGFLFMCCEVGLKFMSRIWRSNFPSTTCWKDYPCHTKLPLHHCQKSIGYKCKDSFLLSVLSIASPQASLPLSVVTALISSLPAASVRFQYSGALCSLQHCCRWGWEEILPKLLWPGSPHLAMIPLYFFP